MVAKNKLSVSRKNIDVEGQDSEYYKKITRKSLDVLNCSYSTLGELISASKSRVQRWLEGKSNPTRYHIEIMERICLLDKRYLMGEDGKFIVEEGPLFEKGELLGKLKSRKTTLCEIIHYIISLSIGVSKFKKDDETGEIYFDGDDDFLDGFFEDE